MDTRAGIRTLCRALVGAALLAAAGGCAALLVGAGAAGGYALGRDSVTAHYDLPASMVFGRCVEVVQEMGAVTLKDQDRGLIKGEVDGANVTVTVKTLTKQAVELKVKARDLLNTVPKAGIAQRIHQAIDKRLQ